MQFLKNMSTLGRILLGLGVSFATFSIMTVLWVIISYVSANNYGAKMEASIDARWKDNQNVFSNYGQKVMEAAQVPAMYRDDLTNVMKDAFAAKFGKNGSQAVFQWLSDAKIDFDSKLYTNIQQIIESGRNDFQMAQTARLDVCRQYKAELETIPRGWFLSFANYPKILTQIPKVCDPITDDRTEEAFTTGKQKTIILR